MKRGAEGVTVAFMGLDGTGKSTQALRLKEAAAALGHPWVMVHHSSTRIPIIGALKRRFHGSAIRILKRGRAHVDPAAGVERPSGVGSGLGWLISHYLLWGSLFKSFWYRSRFGRTGTILDRCVLDDIVKVRWRFGFRSPLTRWVMTVAPKADVVIVLEGDPTITYHRKKVQNCTYPEYLQKGKILDACLSEAEARGWEIRLVEIDDREIGDVHESVMRVLDEYGGISNERPRRTPPPVPERGRPEK